MRKLRWTLGILGGIVVGYGLIEPHLQRLKRYTIYNSNLPKSFNGLRIVFLADIHYGRTIKKVRLSQIVDRVNALEPDLILLGGDYVIDRKYIEPCFEGLKHLKSSYGTYAVLGNHDVKESLEETLRCMEKAKIHSLNNDAVWIGETERIKIGGVGDLRTQRQNLSPTLEDVKEDDFVILLSHNPRYVYQIQEEARIDLVLAGHTHGGQFSPMKYLNKVAPDRINELTGLEYLSGKGNRHQMDVIVSNGIGTAKFPLRLGALPEIIEVTLECSNE